MCRHSLSKSASYVYRIPSDDEDEDVDVHARLEMYTKCIRKPDKYFTDKLGELKLTCPFEDCQQIMDYSTFPAHKNSCTFNPEAHTDCKYCYEDLIRKNIPRHLEKCMEYKLATLKAEMSEIKKSFVVENAKLKVEKATLKVENVKLKVENVKLKVENATLKLKKKGGSSVDECDGIERHPPCKRAKKVLL